jgi:hypothetical protein
LPADATSSASRCGVTNHQVCTFLADTYILHTAKAEICQNVL